MTGAIRDGRTVVSAPVRGPSRRIAAVGMTATIATGPCTLAASGLPPAAAMVGRTASLSGR
eukprot:8708193-Alexandrium_andersonii.AAC.1